MRPQVKLDLGEFDAVGINGVTYRTNVDVCVNADGAECIRIRQDGDRKKRDCVVMSTGMLLSLANLLQQEH